MEKKLQSIWYRNEIKIADELMELAPKLRDEFLEYHKDFHTTFKGGISYAATNPLAILNEDRKSTRLNSSHSQQSRMPSSA